MLLSFLFLKEEHENMCKSSLISLSLLLSMIFLSCVDINRTLKDVPVEVVEPPILPPPGVEFGNLSIWIKKPITNDIILMKKTDKIEIEGQVKCKEREPLNLTLEINNDIQFASNKVYYMSFANSMIYSITPSSCISRQGEACIKKFSISDTLPFFPAFVRVKAVQGNNIFFSPCLIYHFRTQGRYSSEQLKQALLAIILQTDEDVWIETSEEIGTLARRIGTVETGFDWSKLLLTPSYWKAGPQRIVKLIFSRLQTRRNQALANQLHNNLLQISVLMNAAGASANLIGQLSEATLIQAASNAIAEYRLEIIKRIAVESKYPELVSACDAISADIRKFHDDFLRSLRYSIQNHAFDNLENAVSFYELYNLLSSGNRFFNTPASIAISGFMFGFESGMNIGNVYTGRIFEPPFAAIQIGESLWRYLQSKNFNQLLSEEERIDIIETYRLCLYSAYFASLSSSKILEGDLLWEAADWSANLGSKILQGDLLGAVNFILNLGKESNIAKTREELKQLADQYKQELHSFDPPIQNLDDKLIQIKNKLTQ